MSAMKIFAVFTLVCGLAPRAYAQDGDLALTLDDFTQQAIKQGIQGRQNELTLQSAGYTKQVVFKQTSAPTLDLNGTGTRSESNDPLNGHSRFNGPNDSSVGNLTYNQLLPTGTALTAAGKYDESDRPGFTASVTQPLYVFVKNSVARTREQAALSYANAKDTFDATVLSIRTQAHSFYYNVMLGDEDIQVEKRKVASSKALNDVTVALVEAGKLAPVEAMRSKIQLQTDQRTLQNAQTNWQKALLNAKNYIYISFDQPVKFLTRLEFKPFDIPQVRLVNYAMLHNPGLQILRRDRELARLTFEAAEEPTRPTLALNSTYSSSETQLTSVMRNWTAGGSANWLFFDSFITRDQTNIARLGQMAADLSLSDGERTTLMNVETAYLDLQNTQQQIRDFQSSREQAYRNVEVLRLRFQNGLDRLIDVFDAETSAHDLDSQYLGLLVAFNQSKDTLSQLVGGDVEALP